MGPVGRHCIKVDLSSAGFDISTNLISLRKMFSLVQKAHYKSGNVHKLSAAIEVYVGLSSFESIGSEVQLKLTGMLLHPFPNVGGGTLNSFQTC